MSMEGHPQGMEEDDPPEAFSTVWVKIEVDEEGTVEGLDNDEEDQYGAVRQERDQDYVPPESAKPRRKRKATTPKKSRSPVDPDLKRFSCEFCDYKAMHKNALKYHTMKHTNEPPITCKFCNYSTKYPNSMKQHVLGQHTDQNDPILLSLPLYTCNTCDYSTRFKWNLAVHRRKHSVEKNFQCDDCGFASVHRYSFVKHVRRHQPKGSFMYQCDKCPFKTKFEGHISRHLAQIHKEVLEKATKCDNCDFSTRVKWRLNMHKNRSRQQNLMVCERCHFVTEYMCAMKLHKRLHVTDYKPNKIKESDEPYKVTLEKLKVNVDLNKAEENTDAANEKEKKQPEINWTLDHSSPAPPNDKQYIIDTKSEEIDWRSIEVAEIPGEEKSFHCMECEYTSKYKASVQRHFQRLHTNKSLKPYKCINCKFSTKTKDQISLHIKRSKCDWLMRCNSCDFSTFFKCKNVVHQKMHYPIKCKLCDFGCRHNYQLQEHFSIVHLGNALKCKYCDFQAASKSNLINHEVKHTSSGGYPCSLCNFSTTVRKTLLAHYRNNHSGHEEVPTIIDDKKIESLKTNNGIIQNNWKNLFDNVQRQIKYYSKQLTTQILSENENNDSQDKTQDKPEIVDDGDEDNENEKGFEEFTKKVKNQSLYETNAAENYKINLKNQTQFESKIKNNEKISVIQNQKIENQFKSDNVIQNESVIQNENVIRNESVNQNDSNVQSNVAQTQVKYENVMEYHAHQYRFPHLYGSPVDMNIPHGSRDNVFYVGSKTHPYYSSL